MMNRHFPETTWKYI